MRCSLIPRSVSWGLAQAQRAVSVLKKGIHAGRQETVCLLTTIDCAVALHHLLLPGDQNLSVAGMEPIKP